ncbi:MAG: hypothetical protein IKL59_06040 [Clostridia bacterium]|nr:hypothetical protein [Clostridia bacterium]
MISEKDKSIVRELAKQYMAIVDTDKQRAMFKRMQDSNDLKIVRPPVLLDEIPWYQMNMDGELDCVCEDESARKVEYYFRTKLFYLKHFKADNLCEPFFRVARTVHSTGMGIEFKTADLKRTDDKNRIVSREYEDVLEDESALELMHDPEFSLDPEKDAQNMEFYTELLGDSIPIRQYGFGYMSHVPWDMITRLRGVEPMLMDMYDRPEYLHKIIAKYESAAHKQMDFVEKYLDVLCPSSLHCTPAQISGMEGGGLKSMWLRAAAQSFGVVSPEMFKEFELDYLYSIAERFAYTYYGCCEPLDDKIELLKTIPNLRKIGCSPWANVERCAEQIGGDCVLARKPNPAYVAINTDPDVIREETERSVKAALKYGCPTELVLKDISTVSHRPENLIVWSETVSDVLDKYYG